MTKEDVFAVIKEIVFCILVVGVVFGAGYFVGEKYSNKRVWLKSNLFVVSPKEDGKSFLTVPIKYDKKTGMVALDLQQEVKE